MSLLPTSEGFSRPIFNKCIENLSQLIQGMILSAVELSEFETLSNFIGVLVKAEATCRERPAAYQDSSEFALVRSVFNKSGLLPYFILGLKIKVTEDPGRLSQEHTGYADNEQENLLKFLELCHEGLLGTGEGEWGGEGGEGTEGGSGVTSEDIITAGGAGPAIWEKDAIDALMEALIASARGELLSGESESMEL